MLSIIICEKSEIYTNAQKKGEVDLKWKNKENHVQQR